MKILHGWCCTDLYVLYINSCTIRLIFVCVVYVWCVCVVYVALHPMLSYLLMLPFIVFSLLASLNQFHVHSVFNSFVIFLCHRSSLLIGWHVSLYQLSYLR